MVEDSRQQWKAWIYLAPAIALLMVFTVWPIFNTVRMAFINDYRPLQALAEGYKPSFGINNFKGVFKAPEFLTCLKNTMVLCVLTVPISTILALLVAVVLNSIGPLQKLLQTIFFLPYVTNSIAIGMVFTTMFNIIGAPTSLHKTEYGIYAKDNEAIVCEFQRVERDDGNYVFIGRSSVLKEEETLKPGEEVPEGFVPTYSETNVLFHLMTPTKQKEIDVYDVVTEYAASLSKISRKANKADMYFVPLGNDTYKAVTVTEEGTRYISKYNPKKASSLPTVLTENEADAAIFTAKLCEDGGYLLSYDLISEKTGGEFTRYLTVEKISAIISLGVVNNVIEALGGTRIDWINTTSSYMANITVMVVYIVWNALPFKILILLGGLQSINKQYYDAAKIDGTPRRRVLTKITIPLLSPMLAYVIITGFIGGFKEYTSIVGIFGENMGPAGDAGRLQTMVGYIYDALKTNNYGVASASALVLFAIIFAVTMLNLQVSKKKVHY